VLKDANQISTILTLSITSQFKFVFVLPGCYIVMVWLMLIFLSLAKFKDFSLINFCLILRLFFFKNYIHIVFA